MRLEAPADVDRMCRALNVTTRTLEEIGSFDKGVAGDRATETLKTLGVWSDRVERIQSTEAANQTETLAVTLFTAASPLLQIDTLLKWRELHEETKDRWRAYAIEIIDTEGILG